MVCNRPRDIQVTREVPGIGGAAMAEQKGAPKLGNRSLYHSSGSFTALVSFQQVQTQLVSSTVGPKEAPELC